MATFELQITFYGLCLFVPDDGRKTMHVLLPATGTHGTHHVEEHLLLLAYDRAYEDRSGSEPLSGQPRSFDMSGSVPRWTNRSTGRLDLALPAEVANVSSVWGKPVRKGLLTGPRPAPGLASRMSMSTGAQGGHLRGARWVFGGETRELTHALNWAIPGVGEEGLAWDPNSWEKGKDVPPSLFPRGGRIQLYVFHIPDEEKPTRLPPAPLPGGEPSPGEEAHHFAAFYDLLDSPSSRELPKYKGQDSAPGGPQASGPRTGARGIRPFTCMLAQAKAD